MFEKTFLTNSILPLLPVITSAVAAERHGHIRDSHDTSVNSALGFIEKMSGTWAELGGSRARPGKLANGP